MPNDKLWEYERDGITQSFLKSFQLCREQTRLRYIEGWTSRTQTLPLEFGNAFQWVLCEVYRVKGRKKIPSTKSLGLIVEAYDVQWVSENPKTTTAQRELHERVLGLVAAVLPVYVKTFDGDWTGVYTLLENAPEPPVAWHGLEHNFSVVGPDGIPRRGSFDGVFEDRKGRLWLFETKTKGQIDEDLIFSILEFDFQVWFYLSALRLESGRTPAGVVYNVVRRPGQRILKDEPLEKYLYRVRADVVKPDRQDHYFKRWALPITSTQLTRWDRYVLDPLLREVKTWSKSLTTQRPRHWMNAEALTTAYGRSDLFDAIVANDYSALYQRDTVFKELSEK